MIIAPIFQHVVGLYDSYKLKKAKFAEIRKEIEAGNAPAVLQILKDVKFDEAKNEKILKAAILSDNVDVFATVLDRLYKTNVNKTVSHSDNTIPDFPSGLGTRTILAYAIKNDCPAVALRLASDRRTDITKVGQTTYAEYQFVASRAPTFSHTMKLDDTPLFMARMAGMPDVVAVLSQRTAQLKREEAQRLEAEASRLSR